MKNQTELNEKYSDRLAYSMQDFQLIMAMGILEKAGDDETEYFAELLFNCAAISQQAEQVLTEEFIKRQIRESKNKKANQ
jgi:hypothetical protein